MLHLCVRPFRVQTLQLPGFGFLKHTAPLGLSPSCRFTYNCLIHLCAVLGHVEQALSVLAMMHEDGGPDTLPDSYTYAELLKAVVNSRRWKMLPLMYRQIQRSQVRVGGAGWQQFKRWLVHRQRKEVQVAALPRLTCSDNVSSQLVERADSGQSGLVNMC